MLLGPKREEVTAVEEDYITRSFMICMLVIKCYSGDRIKKNLMEGAYAKYWDARDAYRVLVGRHEGKRLLGRN